MAELDSIAKKASYAIKELVKKEPMAVIAINKTGKGWQVLIEILERRAVPDSQDLIGEYEVTLTEAGTVQGYKRLRTRHRGIPYGSEEVEEGEEAAK